MQELIQSLSALPWSEIVTAIVAAIMSGGPSALKAAKASKGKSAAEKETRALERQLATAVKRAEEAEGALVDSERERRMILRELELCRGRG